MKLVLLDSHALIHRAYHAIDARLTSPSGEPTNATYGFTSTLLKVLNDEKPDYIAAAFDVGRTFRDDLYAQYKAHRPPLPDELRVQINRARQVVETLNIPAFGVEGYEADDLLGTLARQASARGIEVVIVTGDSDTFQLIDPNVRVLTFSRQFSDTILYDEAKVQERYGLTPRQLIDFKSLKGDPSDNIPGVAGIGEKTATKLLQQYDNIENLYAHLDELDAKTREKLRAGKAQAEQGKQLVTIVTDAPIALDLDACRVAQIDRERVSALFRELGFRASLLDRLPGATQPDLFSDTKARESARADTRENYHIVDSDDALDQLVVRLQSARAFTVDVETTGTDEMRAELVGIAIGVGGEEAYYIPVATADRRPPTVGQLAFDATPSFVVRRPSLARDIVLGKLKAVFADASIAKYAHNAKYDLTILAEAGVETRGLAFDTMIAASLIEQGGSLGLKNLARDKFGAEMAEIATLIGKGKKQISMADVPIEQVAPYACADADYAYRLVELYQPQIADPARGVEKLFRDVEMPLVPVLMEMERTGVLLDLDFLAQMSRELTARLLELEKQITAHVGLPINIASPVQLADALFNRLKLPTAGLPKTKTGQISTAADVLESLRNAHPIIPLILEHRELSKLKGTYVDALPALVLPRTGRVHTDYNQTGIVTGRVSSSNPNLQNIPIRTELGRQVRRAFIAPRGSKLISADYSQVELRILAHIARDPGLLDAFARGEDIHAATAARLFKVSLDQVTSSMRQLGKTINFGIAYGITDYGVAARTDLSQTEARQLIDNYFAQFAGVKTYIEKTKREAREIGYVQTLLGRRRYFPELQRGLRDVGARNAAEREAINHPIQGSAADIIKIAMVRLHAELHARHLRAQMTLQVHDELVLECPDDEVRVVGPLVRETMEHAYALDSKLKVDVAVGQNWDEMAAMTNGK
ncbi:MAG: DNA polymerase I [Chloroflexi bacterium]|nr:DNA polymerase I [Chloroflexota bacterium]